MWFVDLVVVFVRIWLAEVQRRALRCYGSRVFSCLAEVEV